MCQAATTVCLNPDLLPTWPSVLLFSLQMRPADNISQDFLPSLAFSLIQSTGSLGCVLEGRKDGFISPTPQLSFEPLPPYGFTSLQEAPPFWAPILAGQPLFLASGVTLPLTSISPSSGTVAVSCGTQSPDASLDFSGSCNSQRF